MKAGESLSAPNTRGVIKSLAVTAAAPMADRKFDHIVDSDDDEAPPPPSSKAKPIKVDDPAAAKARAEKARAAGQSPNPLDDLFTLGADSSMSDLMAKMKALPSSAKEQLLGKLTPEVLSKVAGMKTPAASAAAASINKTEEPPQPPQPPQSPPQEVKAELVGSRVLVSGLKSRPELNDKAATVIQWHAAKGRYAVRIDGVDEPLLLKLDNLTRTHA